MVGRVPSDREAIGGAVMKTAERKGPAKTYPFQVMSGAASDMAAARALHERLLPDVRYDFWHQTEAPNNDVFLVAKGGDFLAYAWGDLGGISGKVAYLREVGVEPKAQGSGIGRELIAEFARRAAGAACETIYVDPVEGPAEEGLILYYERCGFTDPTRWRTTRHDRRGRSRMMEGSPAGVVRATTRWAPLVATNAWDVDRFGNGGFTRLMSSPAMSPRSTPGAWC
jgi:GNAT superfamily N-acetyltransferase